MSLTTLMVSIVLARTYDKAIYADIVLLFSINIFVLGFQSSIISRPYAINLNDFKEDKGYFHFNLLLKVLFTFIVVIVFPALYLFLFRNGGMGKMWLYLLYIVSYGSYFFVREILLSQRATKQNLVYGLLCSTGMIALLIVIYLNKLVVIDIFLIFASAVYLTLALFYFFTSLEIRKLPFSKFRTFFSKNWKVGKWMLGSNVFFFLSASIYPWILLLCGFKLEIAILGVLMSVANVINPILTALSSYLLPVFVKYSENFTSLKKLVNNWTKLFIAFSLLLLFIGGVFGQEIVVLLFGGKYANLGLLAFFPFLVQAINVIFQPIKITLNAIKRTDVNFWILIPRSAVSLLLGYFLVTNFGLEGVFYTMIIENIFYQILNLIMYRRIVKV